MKSTSNFAMCVPQAHISSMNLFSWYGVTVSPTEDHPSATISFAWSSPTRERRV